MSDDVEDLIGRRVVDRGRGNALIARLGAVGTQVNQKNISGAIGGLQAFITEMSAAITTGEGQPLIDAAREIIRHFSS